MKIKAHCGCGWELSNSEVTDTLVKIADEKKTVDPKMLPITPTQILAEVEKHSEERNHIVEFHGEVGR